MMNRLMRTGALALVLMMPVGCCTTRDSETSVSVESYKSALKQLRKNLATDIRPGYEEALKRSDLLPATHNARLGVVDDSVRLIDGTLAGATEGETGGEK